MNRDSCLRALLVLTAACAAGPAMAHVTAQPNEGATGGTFRTAFNVPHGCEGSATVAARLKIPDGVIGVKPQLKPGWQITLKMRKVQPPMEAGKPTDASHIQMDQHGTVASETVDEITWRGGPLPDNFFDTFPVAMTLPDAAAGTTLYFPFVQECQKGVQRWIAIPAAGQNWDDLREPAPFVRVKPKTP
jgi:periplasmic copper chaperone A